MATTDRQDACEEKAEEEEGSTTVKCLLCSRYVAEAATISILSVDSPLVDG